MLFAYSWDEVERAVVDLFLAKEEGEEILGAGKAERLHKACAVVFFVEGAALGVDVLNLEYHNAAVAFYGTYEFAFFSGCDSALKFILTYAYIEQYRSGDVHVAVLYVYAHG